MKPGIRRKRCYHEGAWLCVDVKQFARMDREFARMDKLAQMDSKPWNRPYAIVNDGRILSYGHALKPELTLSNHPPPPFDTKFDYSVPVMGQPSDYIFCHQLNTLVKREDAGGNMIAGE
jgi:hypothetical protein